jgi:hypothetical protein
LTFNKTIAVGRVIYYGSPPIVPADSCRLHAMANPVIHTIIPFGGFTSTLASPDLAPASMLKTLHSP